jgi:predicted RND superfamily exporter protein
MKSPIMERLLAFSIRHRVTVIAIAIVITLIMGFYASRIRINPDVASLIPPDEEVTRFIAEYGYSDQVDYETLLLSIGGELAEELTPEVLREFDSVLQAIGSHKSVRNVISPFSFLSFTASGKRLTPRLMTATGSAPETIEETNAFLDALMSTPYARNMVVSEDGTSLLAIFQIERADDYRDLLETVEKATTRLDGKIPYAISGSVPFLDRTQSYMSKDLSTLLILVTTIILIFYFAGFGSLRAVILPLLVVGMGVLWTIGVMSMLRCTLSIISIVMPPLVLTLGTSYSIHMLNQYYREWASVRKMGAADSGSGWIVGAAASINKTIILASVTTVFGFLSLLVTSIRQTRIFAISTSFGIAACAVLSLFFLPAILSLLPPRPSSCQKRFPKGF